MDDTSEEAAKGETPDADDIKIIVRLNGTVTYVGKDIAYHLWKFAPREKTLGMRPSIATRRPLGVAHDGEGRGRALRPSRLNAQRRLRSL